MADEQGKTVKATLKIVIDDADAKRQRREIKKDFDELYKSATLSDWRRRNRIENSKDREEDRRQKKKEHDEEMGHRRSLAYVVQQGRKEEHAYEQGMMRSLGLRVREGRRAMKEAEQERKRVMREEERQEGARGSLALQSLSMMGAGGFAGSVGRMQTYGMLLKNAGFARSGAAIGGASGGGAGLMGPVGWLALGAQVADATSLSIARQTAHHPFATGGQRMALAAQEMMPETYDRFAMYSGLAKENIRANTEADIFGIARRGIATVHGVGREEYTKMQPYQLREQAYQNYGVAGLPTANRATGIGAVEYREQVKLQPLLQAEKRAQIEADSAKMNSIKATKVMTSAQEDYNKAQTRAIDLQRKADAMPSGFQGAMTGSLIGGIDAHVAKTKTLRDAQIANEQADIYNGELEKRIVESRQAQVQSAEAQSKQRSATGQRKRGELENIVAREEHATGQAISLGGMGVAGFKRGEIALQMIVQNGIDYATPEMISAAEGVAPITMRNLKRQLGEKRAKGSDILERFAPEDYSIHGHAGELREKADKARKELAEYDVASEKKDVQQMAQAWGKQWAEMLIRLSIETTEREIRKYILDQKIKIQNKVAGGNK